MSPDWRPLHQRGSKTAIEREARRSLFPTWSNFRLGYCNRSVSNCYRIRWNLFMKPLLRKNLSDRTIGEELAEKIEGEGSIRLVRNLSLRLQKGIRSTVSDPLKRRALSVKYELAEGTKRVSRATHQLFSLSKGPQILLGLKKNTVSKGSSTNVNSSTNRIYI